MRTEDIVKEAIWKNDGSFLSSYIKKYSIDKRFIDEDNDTLLLYAISIADSNSYEFFLKNKADIFAKNDEGENIFHSIVYSGDSRRFNNRFIKNKKIDINHQAKDGATPLLLAVSLEKKDIIDELLDNGADVNIGDNNGITPLHIAVQNTDIEIVKSILRKGANIKAKTNAGNLPISLAANNERDEIVKLLYKNTYETPNDEKKQ